MRGRLAVAGVALAMALQFGSAAAQDLDSDMQSVANRMVSQLEAAHQHSAAVLDFTDLQGAPTGLGRYLAQELSDKLVGASQSISIVDRANVQFLLRENKLSAEGLVNPATSRKLGNLIGVDTIIVGTTTPMETTIRVSVRAIAVETGRIVASQSQDLRSSRDLLQLYYEGVAPVPGMSPGDGSVTPGEGRFRQDTLRFTGRSVIVYPKCNNCAYSGSLYIATVSANLENLSGKNLEMAILYPSLSVGPCANSQFNTTGIRALTDSQLAGTPSLTLVTVGARIGITSSVNEACVDALARSTSTDVSFTFVVLIDGKTIKIPLTAADVPVRVLAPQ